MLRCSVPVLLSTLVGLAAVALPAGATNRTGPPAGSLHTRDFVVPWTSAVEVPGTAGLNAGGNSSLESDSCSSRGECGAGGDYTDAGGHQEAYVADERNGVWGPAIELPGLSTLNFANATLNSISCSAPGNCSAVGDYSDVTGATQAYVASEVDGTWGSAMEVPNFSQYNVSGLGTAFSVSCASPGNCTAGGFFSNYFHQQIAFYVTETGGIWGTTSFVANTSGITEPLALPFTSAVGSISCWAPGLCAGGGFYEDSSFHVQSLLYLNGDAFPLASVQALNVGNASFITSVSCDATGYCGAVGIYSDASGHSQPFALNGGVHGFTTSAVAIPISDTAIGGVSGDLTSVACPSDGTCSAVGNDCGFVGCDPRLHRE